MNILAVNIARHKACPDIKTIGLYGQKRMKIYVSAEVRSCYCPILLFFSCSCILFTVYTR